MANGGRINYTVGFNVDSSGLNQHLQAAIQKIRDSLKEIRTINIKIATAGKAPEEAAKLKKELLEAQDAAKIAGTALQKSFNTKLNTINVTSFNNELRKSNTNITELGQKLSKAGVSGQAAFRNIIAQISKSHVTIKKTNALLDEMKTTMMNSVKWGITSAIWNNMTGSIEKAWSFAKKLDSSLNDIRIVTNKSAEDMEKFAVQANKAAKNLGASTTGYTNASLIYYQQGLSDAEVQARTETTLKAANVTGQSTADVSEQLTAVWNGYKVSANEAELYIDKLSAVAATTAADLEELSTGMSKVASAANIMGVDIDQLNAQLATVVSVTRQAPESVGTAFKTIYARMGDIEAGLDSETTLGNYTAEMSAMGFNVLDMNGKLKDMGEVIEEIGGKWSSMSREQQVALSQTMAGTRQYNNLLALFDNWDEYTKSLETSRDAAGSLQKQQDIYMESMEAHLQKLSTEGERVYNNLFNADAVNPLIDTLTRLVSIIGDAVGGLGGIGPIIMSLGAIFTQVFSKQIGSSITTTFLNMKNAKKDMAELKESIITLQKAGEGTTDKATQQIAKMGQNVKNFALKGIITQEQADELQNYIDKLDELKNIQEKLETQQTQYQEAVDDSIKKMDQSGIDKDVASAQFQKMEEQAEKDGTDYSKLEGEELETALQKNDAYKEFTEIIEKQREKLDEAAKSANKYTKYLTKAENLGNSKEGTATGNKADEKLKKKTQELIKEIQTNDNVSLKQNEALNAAIEKYQKRLQENGGKISEQVREAAKEIATAYQTQVEEMTRNLDEATEAARRTAMGEGRDISQGLQDVESGRENVVNDYNEAVSDINLEEKIGAITQLVGAFGGLFAAINNIVNILQVWNNEELTGPEKLKQTISGLIIAIPIFVTSLQAVDQGLMSVAGKSLFGVGGLLAFKGAEDGAAASAIFLQGTLFPIIAIVAGVMAALIAGVAIFNTVSDAYNADAIAAEKAAKAHEAATQAVNEAKTAYENLKNTIDKYDSAIEKLEDLAMGTDAFKEAMEEANSQAKELISTYGILSDQYFYNAQGAITFKEGVLETLEQQKKEQIAIAERQETIAKWESQKATAKSNKTDTVRTIQNDSGRYSALEDTGWEWLEVADRIIRGITTAGISELTLLAETNIGALGGFNEGMLDEVVEAINANDAANGKLTDAVLDSLPYSQKQKDALKENSKSIEQLVASNKQLLDSQKNEFENLIRQSLQNDNIFNDMKESSQNYLIEMISNQYDSYEEFQKQNNYDEILKSFEEQSIENLGSMYAELKGQAGAKVEGDEVKLYNEQGQLTDIAYTKEQMAAELASEQLLNGISKIMLPFISAVEDVSNKEANLLGRDAGLFSQYLATGEIDFTNMTSKEYSQLLKLLESGNGSLKAFFNSLDLSGTKFNNVTEAMNSFVEQVKKTNFSAIFTKEQEEAAGKVSQGNTTVDKLLKGEALGEEDLNFLNQMQKKYESLQNIWVEELWYNQENISKLKAALEIEEDIVSASKNAEAQWQAMNIAQEEYNESLKKYSKREDTSKFDAELNKINSDKQNAENTIALYEFDATIKQLFDSLMTNTAKLSSNNVPVLQGAKYTSLSEDMQIFAQSREINTNGANSEYIKDTLDQFANNVQSYINTGVDSVAALNKAMTLLKKDVENTDAEISGDAKVAKETALKIVESYTNEYSSYKNASDILAGIQERYDKLQEQKQAATAQEKEDLREIYNDVIAYEKSIQDALTMDLELRIANKDDLLTDVDNVIDRAKNIKTAIESIGDGFKVAADKSDELLRIFPELAAGAKVLSDGTIELNELTVDSILDGEADILDADRNKTVAILQNRIKELDLSIEADKQKLAEVQNIADAEFNIEDYLNDTYKDFTAEEINANTIQAQTEIANDGISTKAIIDNWEQKSLAAAQYAEIAAKAISDPFSVSKEDVAKSYEQYKASVKIDADFSSSGEVDLTDEEMEKRIEERNARHKKQFEDYLQQRIDLSEQERAEYLLAISDIYSSQNDIVAATQKNIDLLKDEIDRYHDINIQLDNIAKKIERINKAQEHLVGADWLAAQEQGLKLLEEEVKLRREKQKIQQAEAVELQGHLLADGVTFNKDGSVANYAEIMKKQMNVVIAAQTKAQESGTDTDKKAAEAAEKNYEAFKKNFERYEELRDDIEDLADEITDMMYEQISKKVEIFTAKLNVKLDTAQAQKEWKEFTNQLFVSANDALSQLTVQSDLLKSDRSIASKATSKYNKIVNEGMKAQALVEGTAEKGTKSAYATYSKELGKYIFDQAKWQEDMEAAQQEAQDSILQIIDDVDSLGETAIGLLEDTIAAQKEQLAIYDDMNSLLSHAMKLQELFVGEDDYDSKAKMYEEQAKVAAAKTDTAKERRQYALDNIDIYAEAYKEAKQKRDEAIANGEGDVTVLEKQLEITEQAYEDMKNELKESTEDFYTSIEEQIEIAKNAYINTINKAMADMENKMTGGKGLSYISDEWDLINKNADRYLDTVNSTYEVQSLEAKYRKAIDSTDNLSAQKKINKAMEEELKVLQEKDKLSQYDIDRANKKYEITMKQIALEEAQANKSSMRLRRDAQGNYSYQFVADENAVADTQQELLALQNELYNFDKERYQQTLDDALAAYQEYQQKMLEAAQINDPEKRAEMEKLITEQYQEYLLAITADNEVAKQNLQGSTMEALQGMYAVNSENFDIMTKGMFEDFKDADGKIKIDFQNLAETELSSLMSGLVTGWDGSVQSMIDKIADPGPDGFKEQSKSVFETAQDAAEKLDDALITLGTNFSGEGNTADKILDDVKDINDKMDDFKKDVLDPTVEKGKEELPDAWAAYKEGVDKAADAINTLIGKLMGAYTNASNLAKKLQDIASQSPINVDINYNTTGDATTPSGNYSSSGGKTGGQPEEKEDPWIGKTIIWKKEVVPFLYRNGDGTKKYFSDPQIYGKDILTTNNYSTSDSEKIKKLDVKWEILADAQQVNANNKPGYQVKNVRTGITGFIDKKDIDRFDTGGYTGEWGAEGRMAMLHEKEIVLNKQDTANILSAVSIVRGIGDLINSLSANLLGSLSQKAINSNFNPFSEGKIEQNVHITADFPNVTSSFEIENALNNLVNVASQRAFIQKR